MPNNEFKMKVFTLSSNQALAREVVDLLGIELGKCSVNRFSDGEIQLNIEESIRGYDTYIIQSISTPGNEHLMELLVMIDALKRASTKTINVVIPYFGYARQDRKLGARQPITAKLIANLLEKAGATRVIAIDLHAPQIQGFFNIPVDELTGILVLSDYFAKKNLENTVVVAPDNSSIRRARKLANRLNTSIAFIDRECYKTNNPEAVNIIGEVKGRNAIIIDDMVDTAGNVTLSTQALLENGVHEVYACFTHAVFSGFAIEKIQESHIKELVVTNTISVPDVMMPEKIKWLSIAPMLSQAIMRVQNQLSISIML
ncbi:ribose-phosphate diphosphokinase [Metabacillus arenae]|uniref:Putative ribose-phosphate pyrophosphokinase n=1 Tax=Metabacillus arenae TaxID=2771434 RepID=A0A926RX53_9BACI|nr:ribose-phosphate pyrophosphokinase [Metabacillus arenae]MBD1379787.1 ribose-phosphate pyrophosphokinase [Metabacillus arenae]